MADEIKNLEVLASLGSKSAAARLREIENDDAVPDVIRTAAQTAWNRARNMRFAYGMKIPGDSEED